MSNGCAIYIGEQHLAPRHNPFGKDVANRSLYRALVEHGPWADQLFLVHNRTDPGLLAENLFAKRTAPKPIKATTVLNHDEISARGVLLRGQAALSELGWMRRQNGERDYSIVGLIHSLAPQAMRAYTVDVLSAPIEPWDALICTSPAVERHLRTLFTEVSEYLSSRFADAGTPRRHPLPHLPVIPLGIDTARFAARGAPERRGAVRQAFGLADDTFTLLWVGRLSFFEKAYPQAMFAAAEETARRIARPVTFLMAGWFPAEETARKLWEETARLYAPSVDIRFLDGNDPDVMDRVWGAADVFVSLVDNTQETFGITPLEAMAAGLPVVVSDWDGYRFTVRHGVTGFRIPTMIAPGGAGELMALRHAMQLDTYQFYGAQVAAHVAVSVPATVEALAALATDGALAARMGAAASAHARACFDWAAVIPQYEALFDALSGIRASAPAHERGPAARGNPVRNDPFTAFADFATDALSPDTVLRAAVDSDVNVAAHHDSALNTITRPWRLSPEASDRVLAALRERGVATVDEIAGALGQLPRDALDRHLVWMCKVGLIDWTPGEMVEIDRV